MKNQEQNSGERPLHIIHVDDDIDDCLFFTQTLEKLQFPHTCKTLNNCTVLLDVLDGSENKFDIIFLDIIMPAANGLECLKKIKAHPQHKDIPVIIFSVSHSPRDIDESYNSGAHYYVVKPHAPINYIAMLRKVFELDWKKKQPIPDKNNFVINYTFN